MIVETVPKNVAGAFVPMTNFFMASGYMLILGSGFVLPDADYHPSLPKVGANLEACELDRADMNWRFVYAFPIFLNILMLLGFHLFIKTDPILYSIRIGDDTSALKLISKVYDDDS